MDFASHLNKYLSNIEINELMSTFSKKEHKGLLLNTNKISDERFVSLFPNVKKHPIVEHCYLFDQDEYQFGKMIYHDLGYYYIQDPSASLVSFFLNPNEEDIVLDMCAAPGGKTVQASFLMNQKGMIYSNDLSFLRAQTLLSNVERMGLGNVIVTSIDLSKIHDLNEKFDKIILDAPCSGSGMFRKSEEMKKDWTYEKVLKQANVQKQLILLAYSFLKKGGTLVYSTCSYSYEEDEEVIKYLLSNSDATLIEIPNYDGFYKSDLKETIHLFPNKFPGEGHFIALIKKPGEISKTNLKPFEYGKIVQSKGKSKIIEKYILNSKPIEPLFKYALRNGLFVSTTIENKTIYSHHYSHFVTKKESYHLSDEELKKYLHGDELSINGQIKDYDFVSYDNNILGVCKRKNKTLRNYYPKGLRR